MKNILHGSWVYERKDRRESVAESHSNNNKKLDWDSKLRPSTQKNPRFTPPKSWLKPKSHSKFPINKNAHKNKLHPFLFNPSTWTHKLKHNKNQFNSTVNVHDAHWTRTMQFCHRLKDLDLERGDIFDRVIVPQKVIIILRGSHTQLSRPSSTSWTWLDPCGLGTITLDMHAQTYCWVFFCASLLTCRRSEILSFSARRDMTLAETQSKFPGAFVFLFERATNFKSHQVKYLLFKYLVSNLISAFNSEHSHGSIRIND